MKSYIQFNKVTRFKSGELDVKLINPKSLGDGTPTIKWNWFKEPDPFMILLKLKAFTAIYGEIPVILECNYLPYSRQERIFELGQPNALAGICEMLSDRVSIIKTMALHCNANYKYSFQNTIINIDSLHLNIEDCYSDDKILVFPDEHAKDHYYLSYDMRNSELIELEKIRTEDGIELTAKDEVFLSPNPKKFLICDDICDGGRTFIECAKWIHKIPGHENAEIELLVYHAFMTHGIEDLKAAGISKVHIINPDSYEYVTEKFGTDYFNYQPIEKEED